MSVRYAPVGWNRNKIIYDVVVLAAAVAYILLFIKIAPSFQDVTKPTSGAILQGAGLRHLRLPDAHVHPLHRTAGAAGYALPAAALQPPPLRRDHVCHRLHPRYARG